MIISQWLTDATQKLIAVEIPTARLDAELILAFVLEKSRTWLIAHSDEILSELIIGRANKLVEFRSKRAPLAYIIGHKEFYRRNVIVTPDVLIPRPETETLIDIVKEIGLLNGSYVIDVGTGSGAIGLTLKKEVLAIHDIILTDISNEALNIAKHNNLSTFHTENVQYIQSDLLEYWQKNNLEEVADLIIANLPYVDRAWDRSPETDHEPALALFADQGGTALIFRLIVQSVPVLKSKSFLLLEADPEQFEAISRYAAENGLRTVESRDYAILLQKD